MSALNDILDAAVAKVTALALRDADNNLIPVVKRKAPKKGETVDPPVQITVYVARNADSVSRFSFRVLRVEYNLEIAIIVPHDGDNTLPTLYTTWREQIRGEFLLPSLPGASTVQSLRVMPGTFLKREDQVAGYDTQQILAKVTSAELI